jgi:DNA invertase Pin-like site-specific DNA recombinase
MGKRLGYIRVSSTDQNTARQLEGAQLDKVFTDKASGKDAERPELDRLRLYAREGDTVIVHSMDRLARNLDDLRRLVRFWTCEGVTVQFVKEGLTFTGEDSPMATLLLSVMGAFAEFERSLILERQREGIAAAKERGVYKGRRPSLTPDQVRELRKAVARGDKTKAELARGFGVSRETLYRYLRDDAGVSGCTDNCDGADMCTG